MPELYSIAYVSRSLLEGNLSETLEQLVRRASTSNAKAGLTGALICSPSFFAQVIEGPEAELEETFERIQMDRRHCDIEVLYLTPIGARQFGNWGMASAGVLQEDTQIAAVLASLGETGGVADTDVVGKEAMSLLTRLLRERELA